MFWMFQWLRSRIAAIVLRVVPISLPICASEISGMVADDPGDAVGLVLPLRDRRVARALGAADLDRRALHLEAVVRDRPGRCSISSWRQLARVDRIAPGVLASSRDRRPSPAPRGCAGRRTRRSARSSGAVLSTSQEAVACGIRGVGWATGSLRLKIEGPPLPERPLRGRSRPIAGKRQGQSVGQATAAAPASAPARIQAERGEELVGARLPS